MKILIATDKFKGSLTAFQVCEAIAEGLSKTSADFEIVSLPLSDGGDGLLDVLNDYATFSTHKFVVSDPLFRPVEAGVLLSEDKQTAFIEMASASGLQLLQPHEYNCSITSTFGTGELIKQALKLGVSKIILGIGGSATNDCGIGLAAALGYRFLDEEGQELQPIGGNLGRIQSIDASKAINTDKIVVQVACDVTNPLIGEQGATYIYGPQKGATEQMLKELEAGMLSFAELLKSDLGKDVLSIKGGGAAGGMGAGCVAFLNAELVSGIELVFQIADVEKHISEADLIITGEGKIDAQTLKGKLIHGITSLSLRYKKPVIAICGTLALNPEQMKDLGLLSAFSIINRPMSLEEASENAFGLTSDIAYQLGQTLRLGRKS
jgi:glycerate kinase